MVEVGWVVAVGCTVLGELDEGWTVEVLMVG